MRDESATVTGAEQIRHVFENIFQSMSFQRELRIAG